MMLDEAQGKESLYREAMKQSRERYGPDAEISSPSKGYGTLTPVMPIEQRIAELAKHVAEAGHQLAVARANYDEATRAKAKAHAVFAEVSSRLLEAIHEHREGTPEGVPYQP